MKRSAGRNPVPRLLFLVYCGVMLWLLFGQRWGQPSALSQINLVPLKTIKQYISLLYNETFRTHAIINLAGNVLVFVPLGYLLPKIWERLRGFFRTTITVMLLVILIELLQYVTGLGSCDIDDLILNLIGAILGYIFWKMKKR